MTPQDYQQAGMMHWYISDQYDPRVAQLADRHYSRMRPGTRQIAPPGRMLVLVDQDAYASEVSAVWVSSWPYAAMLRRTWATESWMDTLFRNESPVLSSELILEAIAATRWYWGMPPRDGIVTIIDQRKVKSVNPGYCYKMAGFQHSGYTQRDRLHILQLLPEAMPAARMPLGARAKQIELARHVEQIALLEAV
jgi:hypothetical protein